MSGNSISAYQIVIRINERYDLDDNLAQMFATPDIYNYCQHISDALEQKNSLSKRHRITKVARDGSIKASAMQQSLWYLSEIGIDFTDYNHVLAFRLKGQLDRSALENAINAIIERHEILRTTFRMNEGDFELRQIVNDELPVRLSIREVGEEDISKFLQEHAHHRFDLRVGPNLKSSILRLGEEENILVVTISDIAFDRWSVSIFLDELSAVYQAMSQNKATPLAPLDIQYGDYVMWQEQENARNQVVPIQSEYWKRQLEGAPTKMKLPLDFIRPNEPSNKGSTEDRLLPSRLLNDLNNRAIREDATLFMVLVTAFSMLLHRISKQQTILIGTLISNRDGSNLESLIGPFLSTVVLRCDMDPSLTFAELLGKTKNTVLEASENKNLSFGEIIKAVNPPRSADYNPLFQVMFAMQNIPIHSLTLDGIDVASIPQFTGAVSFDLSTRAQARDDGLLVTMDYKSSLFRPATIRKWLDEFQEILESL